MKFFVDTANVKAIKEIDELGLCDGVTTNPSLAAKEGKGFKQNVQEICAAVPGVPVSAEVVALDAEGMIKEAREVSSWAANVVVKVPMIPEGVKAMRVMHAEGIKTNCTLIFSAVQALLACKAGATYISPFIGRLDDLGVLGMELIEECRTIIDNYGFESEIITASVRHPLHVAQAALVGADIATIPPGAIKKLFSHPLTDRGMDAFMKDWEKAGLKIFE
jgi:transaldolase